MDAVFTMIFNHGYSRTSQIPSELKEGKTKTYVIKTKDQVKAIV